MRAFENLAEWEKKAVFMCGVKPTLNTNHLFSDGTIDYRKPEEPMPGDLVAIRLRTGRFNVDKAILVANNVEYVMKRVESDIIFDYYEATIKVTNERVFYYFKVEIGKAIGYYNQIGATKDLNPYYNFQIMPGFKTPAWAKGAVMYQIYVDRFYNGDKSNDVLDDEYTYIGEHVNAVKDWGKYPAAMGVREFYGGDLKGVYDKLDYLESLGIEVIYLNPIFVSPSNHKYDIQDYDHVDPHFGVIVSDEGDVLSQDDKDNTHATRYIDRVTNPKNLDASDLFFAKLVAEIHRRGMKVIIDGVFNHCGSFNKWLDREHIYSKSNAEYSPGAYEVAESPYNSFFKFYGNEWPNNDSYDGWWGHDTLPTLNYEESKKLEDYILNIGRKWVSPPFNVDGWRLDVAADLGHSAEYNHEFWRKFRDVVKHANPNAIILAENYGDSYDWLQGDQWDTIMNYDAFMEPITWFLTGMEKHSDEYRHDSLGNPDYFFGAMRHNMARMGQQSYMISMNELSNHDHSRFLTRTNKMVGRTQTLGPEKASENVNKAVFKEAVVMQFTWPGAPTIYYGDEAGVCGFTDPDNRRTYPWGNEDKELIQFHKDIIKLHNENKVFRVGSYKALYSDYNLIAYSRFTRDDAAVVIINNNDDERRIRVSLIEAGFGYDDDVEQIMVTFENGYSIDKLGYHLKNGWLDIGIRKTSAVVLRRLRW
ncbi:glycoside hydrolase family 13 protein [Lachnospira multipara]|uniref:glycoside hydrolase family 13 protein n=1 Tax=Lachnospira multipara TaxID=28051 RepID=UPI003B513260